MTTLSLRMPETDMEMLKKYVKMNNLSLSGFVREAIMDKIEDEFLDEDRILAAWKAAENEPWIPAEELWKELGV